MIRWLYDRVLQMAQHKYATAFLAAVSFVESSIFPIPPDVLLIPMVIARPQRWAFYAMVCTLSSIAGAFLGYYIGAALYDSIGQPILAFYGKENAFDDISRWYNTWGGWGVLFAAITPFPYKVLTIFSGATGLNLGIFTIVSIVGRGARFFLVAWLLHHFGEPIRDFIEKRLGLVLTVGMILLIGGFVAIKFVF